MDWSVTVARRLQKQISRLPQAVKNALVLLIRDIEQYGPVRGDWPNYGSLAGGRHHCHLKKGRPTYVAVWQILDNRVKLVEITYVGTHEKVPY